MGIGGVAVIGVGLALTVGSVTAVVSSKTESDGGQPVELVDARKDEADDGVRLVDDDDGDDDTTGDGTTVGETTVGDTTGDGTTVGDTTGVGARSAPAPAPAPAGTTPRPARPAPAPKPRPAPAPAPAPPADDSFSADSGDASSYSADSSG